MGMILIMSVLSKYGLVHQNLLFIFLESIKDFREPRTIKMALLWGSNATHRRGNGDTNNVCDHSYA